MWKGISDWLYARTFQPDSRWRLANLAPVIGVVLDYLENLSTSIVMLRYPNRTPGLVTLAPVFTALKWLFVSAGFVLLLAGVGARLWQWLRTKYALPLGR